MRSFKKDACDRSKTPKKTKLGTHQMERKSQACQASSKKKRHSYDTTKNSRLRGLRQQLTTTSADDVKHCGYKRIPGTDYSYIATRQAKLLDCQHSKTKGSSVGGFVHGRLVHSYVLVERGTVQAVVCIFGKKNCATLVLLFLVPYTPEYFILYPAKIKKSTHGVFPSPVYSLKWV